MKLLFQGVSSGPLQHVQGEFDAGVSLVLGRNGAALDEFCALSCGERRPQRGSVLVAGAPVARVPRARRAVAALLANEALPPARSVQAALQSLLDARELRRGAAELLGEWQLESWASRRPSELAPGETRSLALCLALCDEQSQVLALFEPLASGLERRRVIEVLRQRSKDAAVIVCSSSLEDARELGGRWLVLDGGTLSAATPEAFTESTAAKTIVVRTRSARRLAALLSGEQAISAVTWDERRAPHELALSGPDASALGTTLARLSLENELVLDSVAPLVPPLEAVLAARAGSVQGAYEAAYRRAQVMAPAAAPPIFASAGHAPPAPYQSPSAKAPEPQSVNLDGPEKPQ